MNALYAEARQRFATGRFDWTDADAAVTAHLLHKDYTFDEDHELAADVSPFTVCSVLLTGRTAERGYCNAAPVTITDAPPGQDIGAVVVSANSPDGAFPVIYFGEAFGVPFTTSEAEIVLVWHAEGLFRL